MESGNLQELHQDHHHLQLVGSSSSSSPPLDINTDSSCFGASTTFHQWSPRGVPHLNSMSLSHNYSNEMLNTRDHNNNNNNDGSECMSLSHMHDDDHHHDHSLNHIHHDLALQWHHHHHQHQPSSYDDHHHHHHDDHHDHSLLKIKEELSSSTTSDHIQADKFTDMLNTPLVTTTNYLKIGEHNNDMAEKLLLKTISSGFPINGDYCNFQPSSSSSSSSSSSCSPSSSSSQSHRGGNFSHIYPSVNISSLSQTPRMSLAMNMNITRAFDMNMHVMMDGRSLYSGSGLVNSNANPQEMNVGMMVSRGSLPFGLGDHHHHLQPTLEQPSCTPLDQMPLFSNDPQASEGKKNNLLMATKGMENVPKKPRVESRSSCPPLKVRKEKLGDRIAALQQLVSPFGKTDTASVLMEAIGYIKFLQNQIETLSVPYMRASRNRTVKSSQGGSVSYEGNEEQKRDLRSRGLCLVPLSCMSYVTGDSGGGSGGPAAGFWPAPPGFGGGP